MYFLAEPKTPKPGETLDNYIQRLRNDLHLSQQQLATQAGIHIQSMGKIERGQTQRLNQKTKTGLASALSIPVEYLDAVLCGQPVSTVEKKQFCPKCWIPGSKPDPVWLMQRAKYCLTCGTTLRTRCRNCSEAIADFKHRFCPSCGTAYSE